MLPMSTALFGTPVLEGSAEVMLEGVVAEVDASPTVETMSVRVIVAERVVMVCGGRVDGRMLFVGPFWSVPAMPNKGLVLFISPSTAKKGESAKGPKNTQKRQRTNKKVAIARRDIREYDVDRLVCQREILGDWLACAEIGVCVSDMLPSIYNS